MIAHKLKDRLHSIIQQFLSIAKRLETVILLLYLPHAIRTTMNHSNRVIVPGNSFSLTTHHVHNLKECNTSYSSVTHPLDAGATSLMYCNNKWKREIQHKAKDYSDDKTDNVQARVPSKELHRWTCMAVGSISSVFLRAAVR